jgi:hypothetical protein
MLASTMQFSNNQPSPTQPPASHRQPREAVSMSEENSRSLRTQQRARQTTLTRHRVPRRSCTNGP